MSVNLLFILTVKQIEFTNPVDKKLKNYIISALRKISYWQASRKIALNKNRYARGLYLCEICRKVFHGDLMTVDHICPIVPLTGWDSWDGYIGRLFCDASRMQAICKPCHSLKSKAENAKRREYTKAATNDLELIP